jgi:amino acid adenylation domain-containing protein
MKPQMIQKGFEQVAKDFPNKIAVKFGEKKISYSDLENEANILANRIRNNALNEKMIGISAKKSIQTIVNLLAILKAGKAFMPIDPDYPVERLQYMVEISGLKIMLDEGVYLNHWKRLGLDALPNLVSVKDNFLIEEDYKNEPAVILFTSGSTGKPKGVVLGHQGLWNNIQFQCKYPWNGPGIKTLQYAHLAFDGAVLEIFSALCSGGELHLIDEDQRLDNLNLLEYLVKNEINRVFLPNVALQSLIEEALVLDYFPTSLKEITTAGELLKITQNFRQFFKNLPETVLKNAYGPTEASVCVTEFVLDRDPNLWEEVPCIGKEISGVRLWVLDKNLIPVMEGETGELYISGDCLAFGYVNRKDISDEKFFYWESPNEEIVRIYNTGDWVKKGNNGNYYFKGRKDEQIKIRGNRVEIGEVEIAISRIPGVLQVVVKPQNDQFGQKFLSGYIKAVNFGELDLSLVKKQLKRILPDFMIPEYLVEIREFSKTSSGKIDKQALPIPEYKRPEWAGCIIQPVSGFEKNVLKILKGILLIDELSVTDNFFEFGGNSIKAQYAIAQLRNQFNFIIPISKFYQYPTTKQLCEFLVNQEKNDIGKVNKYPGSIKASSLQCSDGKVYIK